MKFNFFVLIACLMIHFIAQAGNDRKASKPTPKVEAKADRVVASGSAECNCEEKKAF